MFNFPVLAIISPMPVWMYLTKHFFVHTRFVLPSCSRGLDVYFDVKTIDSYVPFQPDKQL